jgi:hypothetical protein
MAVDERGRIHLVWNRRAACRGGAGRAIADEKGMARFSREVLSEAPGAAYPVVATTSEGVIAAWTSGKAGEAVPKTALLAH